ncbi:unnamed protein product, partial [Mesorhabditis belari]|uniref:Rho GTPase n=1 Tax=Mesorhabditis belari TaxID=2138241 RepID=A0AAF3FHF7_9BILA
MQSIKCSIIGDSGIGKTSLLIAYTAKAIPGERYTPTIFDHYSANVMFNERSVSLGIWETIGRTKTTNPFEEEEEFEPFCSLNNDVVLICFSVVDPSSFENVRTKWSPEVSQHCPDAPVILVGLKSDLRNDDKTLKDLMDRRLSPISERQGELMAKEINAVKYIECSSQARNGIKQVFDEVIRSANRSNSLPKKPGKVLTHHCCPM